MITNLNHNFLFSFSKEEHHHFLSFYPVSKVCLNLKYAELRSSSTIIFIK